MHSRKNLAICATDSLRSQVVKLGFDSVTSGFAVRLPTNCAMEPGTRNFDQRTGQCNHIMVILSKVLLLTIPRFSLRKKKMAKNSCSTDNLGCFMTTILNSPCTNESVHYFTKGGITKFILGLTFLCKQWFPAL